MDPRPCGPSRPLGSGDRGQVFGAVDDVAVGLLPPPLLQRSFSLALRSFSRRVRRLSRRAASPSQATASLFRRFPLLALQRRWVRFRSSCNKCGGDLGSFFLAGQILSSICSKLYSCVSFHSISVVRSLHPCLVHSMYARPSFFCSNF